MFMQQCHLLDFVVISTLYLPQKEIPNDLNPDTEAFTTDFPNGIVDLKASPYTSHKLWSLGVIRIGKVYVDKLRKCEDEN
jgi:hypothetical protein